MIRQAATEMGGVIIKVGQFLSTRVDVLPEEYIANYHCSRMRLPPVHFQAIAEAVQRSFGSPMGECSHRWSHSTIAAASLGQVHGAPLQMVRASS